MPELLSTPLRTAAGVDGQPGQNKRGDFIVGPGLGLVREIAVADVDLTLDPHDGTTKLGPANAIEVAVTAGALTITGADGVDVTLGVHGALAVGWQATGLCITGLKASGSTVTYVRVRW